MNKTLNTIVSIVAIAGLVLGFVAYNKTPQQLVGSQGPVGPQGERGPAGRDGVDGKDGITKVVTQVVEKPTTLGSVTGPDTYFPYTANNGLEKYVTRKGFNQATTTIWSAVSPSATSTARIMFCQIIGSATTTGTTILTMAKSATGFATTTSLGSFTIPAGLGGSFIASSTIGADIFAPNQYLVVGLQGSVGVNAGAGTFSPSGTCEVEFTKF